MGLFLFVNFTGNEVLPFLVDNIRINKEFSLNI